jgi:predicted NUDIX family NTP pyrophosphohydrolase
VVVKSSGLLQFRISASGTLEVLIVHPGGPFWVKKDDGAWSVPKGEYGDDDEPFAVAVREFTEELGSPPAKSLDVLELGEIRQPSGKRVTVFAQRGDFDASSCSSNTFDLEWPRGSGKVQSFPEVDRAAWVPASTAKVKLLKGQAPFIDLLVDQLRTSGLEFELGDSPPGQSPLL